MEKDYKRIRAAILIVSMVLLVLIMARSRWGAPLPGRYLPPAVVAEVKGDVSRPGIYSLDGAEATVAGAAVMAGCPWEGPAAVAPRKLIPGQSLEILGRGAQVTIRLARMPGAALLACGLKLDLNSASLDELLLIPQMRADIATSIVERRREKAWTRVDDLTEIRGVGRKTAQRLQDYLEVSADNRR